MDKQQLHTRLFTDTLAHLPYRGEPHPRAIIGFCGVPGSGKTTVAARLTKDLHANYIQQDAMRDIVRKYTTETFPVHPVSEEVTFPFDYQEILQVVRNRLRQL